MIKELFERVLRRKEKQTSPNTLYVTSIVRCPKIKFEHSEYNFAFLAGTAIHELIQREIIEDFGKDWEVEVSVIWNIPPYQIRGRVDFLNRKEKILIELKTGDFSLSHILQVRCYLNKFPGFAGYLVYLSKNNSTSISEAIKVMKFTVPLKDEDIANLARHYIEKIGPPSREFCGECYYAKDCKERGKELFQTVWAF